MAGSHVHVILTLSLKFQTNAQIFGCDLVHDLRAITLNYFAVVGSSFMKGNWLVLD
jgi:hypothetical protein